MATTNNDDPRSAGTAEVPLTFTDFVARSRALDAPLEAWVRAAIVDVGPAGSDDTTYGIAGTAADPSAGTMRITLAATTILSLIDRDGAEGPWRLLSGHEATLRLRADPSGYPAEVTLMDIAPRWLDRWYLERHRERMATLAGAGAAPSQRGRQVRRAVRSVEVLRDAAPAPGADATLRSLGFSGVSRVDIRYDSMATATIASYFERLASGAPRPDAVLLLVTEERAPAFLNDVRIARLAIALRAPVILGSPRPRSGSLLHEVVFGALDGEAAAAAFLEMVVEDGLKAEAHIRRARSLDSKIGRRRP